ncbi:hypothetical protein QP938_01785 [Porticoccaceae bacterium LTM1]|nr:hypothetical protein QP938_01785 [Porticoccaceae bacterium LTM1]
MGIYQQFPRLIWMLALVCFAGLTGCASGQIHSSSDFESSGLEASELVAGGVAFITPSTVTGQEADRQALALIFTEVIREARPEVEITSLSQTLSAINEAGLSDQYKQMYVDYSDTGIFKLSTLQEISKSTGRRYLFQLKLSSFKQDTKGRFSALGLRLFQTTLANIRLFLQVWDAQTGAIVWEGNEEVTFAEDTGYERPVTFESMVRKAAGNLIKNLP